MRAFFGCLLYLFLVFPILFAGLFLASISVWVFDREFYKELFSTPELYTTIIADNDIQQSLGIEFGNLPQPALEAGLRAVLTPEYLESQADQVVDQFFNELNTGRQTEFLLDLTLLKDHLEGDGARLFAESAANALPVCEGDVKPTRSVMPTCQPASAPLNATIEQIQGALQDMVVTLPDQITLGEGIQLTDPPPDGNLEQWLAIPIAITLGLGAILGLFTALIAARYARGRWAWLAIMLMIPALLMVGLGSLLQDAEFGEMMVNELITDATVDQQEGISLLNFAFGVSDQVSGSFINVGQIAFFNCGGVLGDRFLQSETT